MPAAIGFIARGVPVVDGTIAPNELNQLIERGITGVRCA